MSEIVFISEWDVCVLPYFNERKGIIFHFPQRVCIIREGRFIRIVSNIIFNKLLCVPNIERRGIWWDWRTKLNFSYNGGEWAGLSSGRINHIQQLRMGRRSLERILRHIPNLSDTRFPSEKLFNHFTHDLHTPSPSMMVIYRNQFPSKELFSSNHFFLLRKKKYEIICINLNITFYSKIPIFLPHIRQGIRLYSLQTTTTSNMYAHDPEQHPSLKTRFVERRESIRQPWLLIVRSGVLFIHISRSPHPFPYPVSSRVYKEF